MYDGETGIDDFDDFDDFSLGEDEIDGFSLGDDEESERLEAKTDEYRGRVVRAMDDLSRQVQELASIQTKTLQALSTLVKSQADGQRAQSDVVQALDRLASSFAREQTETRAILTAPKELMRDADGKPVGA